MWNRHKLFATFIPLAAMGLLVGPDLELINDKPQLVVVGERTMLDAAPRGRGPIRGARPAAPEPAAGATAPADKAATYEGNPRSKLGSRPLPQAADNVVMAEHEPRLTGPRGARAAPVTDQD